MGKNPAFNLGMLALYALLGFFALLTLIPFVYLLCAALKTQEAFFSSHFLPTGDGFAGIAWSGLTLGNFAKLFTDPNIRFGRSLLNSVFFASITATLSTVFAAMGGYALAKFEFRLNKLITTLVVLCLVVPPSLLIAPAFKLIYHLGMLDSYTGLVLPALAPAYGVFLFRQAMLRSVPMELIDAARMDGCGEIGIFFNIVAPLIRPMIGTFMMISFLQAWNNFISPQIILQSPEKFPLAVSIAQLKDIYSTDYGVIMAGTLVAIAPVLCLFLLLQKEFISGLTSGAVKG